MPEATETPELVRVGRACAVVGRTARTLRRWAAAGEIREFRDARGVRHYALDDLLAKRPRLVQRVAP